MHFCDTGHASLKVVTFDQLHLRVSSTVSPPCFSIVELPTGGRAKNDWMNMVRTTHRLNLKGDRP